MTNPQNDFEDNGASENNQLTVIEDEDGLVIFGAGEALIEALEQRGAKSRPFSPTQSILSSLGSISSLGGLVTQESGRWVKLTEESAKLVAERGGIANVPAGVVRQDNGQIIKHIKFDQTGLMDLNPASFVSFGMYMQQMALQQQLEEIQEYLVTIDKKLDTLIRDQHDRVISEIFGLQMRVDEAAEIAQNVGELGDIAWSKIDDAEKVLAEAQAYALRKIEYLRKEISKTEFSSELQRLMNTAVEDVPQWMLVCAHALKIGDQVALLELEKVQHDTPQAYLAHRHAKKRARQRRLQLITDGISVWGEMLVAKAEEARDNKLLHPITADAVISDAESIARDTQNILRVLADQEMVLDVGERPAWLTVASNFVSEKSDSISRTAEEASTYAVEQLKAAPQAISSAVSSVFKKYWD
ncbi:hypothetical protein [Arcanobacterium buesumense]|uniref:Uncharacterized protein n=1 Tax=Arcanobacterium buesumense TaxID=2722751 RepID=A0A6H2EMT0_9ACTO|nr:hypothetical protein [Arcanobacterium buesumense]QJC22379.1 hypothetical protein HC352_07575 [Arcanobacterium buesumense]